jgi:hypothetical protein
VERPERMLSVLSWSRARTMRVNAVECDVIYLQHACISTVTARDWPGGLGQAQYSTGAKKNHLEIFCVITTQKCMILPLATKIFQMDLNTCISPGRSYSLFRADHKLISSHGWTPKKTPKIFCGWFQWHKWVNSGYCLQNILRQP